MMNNHLQDEMCAEVESYVLGLSIPDERIAFEQHLEQCSACRNELEEVSGLIAHITPGSQILPGARASLMSKLRETKHALPSEVVFALPGLLATRPENMEWQPAGIEGVWAKTLFEDAARNYRTSLVRLASGAHYPAHKHAGVEEAYVLQGDLHFDAGILVAGDYCRADSGSLHSSSYTENGCLLLIRTSCDDQLLTA